MHIARLRRRLTRASIKSFSIPYGESASHFARTGSERHPPQPIRTRLTLWFVSALAVVLLLYSSAACFFLLWDLRRQLSRHAVQDLETVEGLLHFTPQGTLTLREDYHNHPESKQVLERLLEIRSWGNEVLFRNDLLRGRSLGDTLLPGEGEGGYSERQFVLSDGEKVQLVSRRHLIDGRPTIIRVAFSEAPLWVQFRSTLETCCCRFRSSLPSRLSAVTCWLRSFYARLSRSSGKWKPLPANGFMNACR